MIHPDYVIYGVPAVVILALLPIRVWIEQQAELRKERKQAARVLLMALGKKNPPLTMSPEKFAELITAPEIGYMRRKALVEIAERWRQEELHESRHSTDGLEYPLTPSRYIPETIKYDAPYHITKVILPMENDRQKWN